MNHKIWIITGSNTQGLFLSGRSDMWLQWRRFSRKSQLHSDHRSEKHAGPSHWAVPGCDRFYIQWVSHSCRAICSHVCFTGEKQHLLDYVRFVTWRDIRSTYPMLLNYTEFFTSFDELMGTINKILVSDNVGEKLLRYQAPMISIRFLIHAF